MLPPALSASLELDGMTQVAGSFVDEELRWRHCDLLFATRSRGRAAFVYVLMEHQSSSDRWMALRMLRYVTRIWDRHRVEHPDEQTLPLVVPVVVHHGWTRWHHPTDVAGLLDLESGWTEDTAAAAVLPRFPFLLDDLSRLDERALRARPLTAPARVTLLLLGRTAANPDLVRELAGWVTDLRAVLDRPRGIELFRALVTYIETAGEAQPEELRHLMQQVGPDAEEAYMTTADMLRAEGEARGRAEGEARGRAEALLQLLALRFGPVSDGTAAAVRAAATDRIAEWTARVLTAASVEDVLR